MDINKLNDKRVLLSEVIVSEDDPVIARVSLKLGEQTEWGESTGEKKIVMTLIGQATLEALNKILPRTLDAKLDYVEAVAAQRENTPQTALSLIRFRELQKEIFLNGSCPIGESPYQAAAKSVLDALNRKIDVEIQRAALRARTTGALVATSDMMAVINTESSIQASPSSDSFTDDNSTEKVPKTPIKAKETNIVEDALNLERASNLSAQAYSASMKGNYEQAAFYYQQAVDLEDTNAKYYYELGLVLSKLTDKKREARIALKRAAELNPSEPTYAKELDYFDRGDQLEKLPSIENTSIPGLSREEEPKNVMQKSVSNKVIVAVIAIILFIGATPVLLFFFNSEFGEADERAVNPELPPALNLVHSWPSIESGKTIKQKASEIVKKDNPKGVPEDAWFISVDKTGKTTVSFFYSGKKQKVEATWSVDVGKKIVLPTNPGAETISGKVQ